MELNKIYCGDCRNMDKIDDESIHLTVGSPPYAVNKEYESYVKSLDEHFKLLFDAYKEVVRVTVPGGKICINIGDNVVGSAYNGGFPEEIMILPKVADYLRTLDTYLHARIIWEKDDPWANNSHVSFHSKIQHGSYRVLPAWEYVFVFRKGKTDRLDKSAKDGRWITKKEWKKLVHGVWRIRSVQRNNIHEAMFPEELAANCIKLYSFPGDTVLDTWMGSGTTAVAAKKLGRNFIGYELREEYVKYAKARVESLSPNLIEKPSEYIDKTVSKLDQNILFGD